MNESSSSTIHESAYIDRNVEIGNGTKIWHFSHVLPGSIIGENCSIGQNVVIGPNVSIGSGCKIQNNVSIYEGVTLGSDVFCGPSCVFTNVVTPRAHVERKNEFAETKVYKGVSIGANATIICGVSLGKYCMIAAGAVVTKNVPEFALVAGLPAKKIGWVSRSGDKLNDSLSCPRTGEQYELVDDRLKLKV